MTSFFLATIFLRILEFLVLEFPEIAEKWLLAKIRNELVIFQLHIITEFVKWQRAKRLMQ